MNLASVVISSVLQVLAFAAVPFAFYLVSRRKARGFLDYVGLLRRPTRGAMLQATLLTALATLLGLLLFYLSPEIRTISLAQGTTGGEFSRMGLSASTLVVVLVRAFVQTGLSEELLFRGFLAKRLITRLGFVRGNALQALLFAAPHLLIFVLPGGPEASVPNLGFVLVVSAVAGWGLGFVNERVGNGSIVPSWWAHGLANTVGYLVPVLY